MLVMGETLSHSVGVYATVYVIGAMVLETATLAVMIGAPGSAAKYSIASGAGQLWIQIRIGEGIQAGTVIDYIQ